ncbi:hypothetical protein ACFQX7_07030 [Luedemannella flava]
MCRLFVAAQFARGVERGLAAFAVEVGDHLPATVLVPGRHRPQGEPDKVGHLLIRQ